jgi:hypothetical protein
MKFLNFLLLGSVVNAFGYQVHSLIGTVTYELFTIPVKKMIQELNLIGNLSFGEASVYADKIKRTKEYRWTAPLHYTNLPGDPPAVCLKINYTTVNGNILSELEILMDKSVNTKSLTPFEFKLLIHLLQDLHQPLHLTGKLRGGNSQIIRIKNRKMTLHSYWDTFLFETVFKGNTTDKIVNFFLQEIKNENFTCGSTINFTNILSFAQEVSDFNCNCGVWTPDVIRDTGLLLYLIKSSVKRSYCIFSELLEPLPQQDTTSTIHYDELK